MPHPNKMSEQDPRPVLNQIAGPRLFGPGSGRAPSREAHGAFAAIVVENRVRWDYVAPILSLHLLALLALVPWLFSWTGPDRCSSLGVNVFGQLGVPIGYHRLLTHRSFKVPKWLERSFVVLACAAGKTRRRAWVSLASHAPPALRRQRRST